LQRDELFVGATFDYPPTLQHNDLVASRTVLSRCAMMMQVQPRRRRLSSMAFSVIGSSAAVASSITKNRGIGDKRSGYLDTLTLTAAEIAAPSLTWQS